MSDFMQELVYMPQCFLVGILMGTGVVGVYWLVGWYKAFGSTSRKRKKSPVQHPDNVASKRQTHSGEPNVSDDEDIRKERLATLGNLTATVGHELRNPLAAMRSSMYILQTKSDKNDARTQQAIERVDRNISRCDHIIDELLDFTRIKALDRQLTNIDEWLDSMVREQAHAADVVLHTDLGLNQQCIEIDQEKMRRAIVNVIENAVQALQGHDLTVDKKTITLSSRQVDDRIEITITDNGCGMTDEVKQNLFTPLFSTKDAGVGLGMPAVKQIMEQHGGGIEIESAPGEGARVTLWLPMTNVKG